MNARTLLILSLVVLSGAPCASAQSFKERLKNAAKKIEQKVKQEVAPKNFRKSPVTLQVSTANSKSATTPWWGRTTIRTLKTKLPPSGCRRPTLLFCATRIPCRGNVWDQIGKAGDAAERGIRSGELE